MKTSNKLLLTIALTMLIIPILVVAITVKTSYVSRKAFEEGLASEKSFTNPSPKYLSKKLSEFSSIHVDDASDLFLDINVVADNQSGIKIPEKIAEKIIAEVHQGVLTIKFRDLKDRENYFPSIIIYTTKANMLTLGKLERLNFSTSKDSLSLKATGTKYINFDSPKKMKGLSIEADHVDVISLGRSDFEHINLKLDSTAVIFTNANINALSVNAIDKSAIRLNGEQNTPKKFTVNYFKASLAAESDITINNVDVLKADGQIADDSKLDMPAKYLHMFLRK